MAIIDCCFSCDLKPTAPSSSKTSEPPAKRKRVAATKRKQPQKVKPEEDSDEDSASEEALVAKVVHNDEFLGQFDSIFAVASD